MYKIKPITRVRQQIDIPPDKSISHRAAIISAIAGGETHVEPFLSSDDTLATLDCLKKLGIKVKLRQDSLIVEGKGLYFPKKRKVNLFAGESGTTFRILTGLLAGQNFSTFFDAAPSLRARPMGRISSPLRKMGAKIKGTVRKSREYAPLVIEPAEKLSGIRYTLPIPSAQVKSAIIMASVYARGATQIIEPVICRDHTERMVALFKAGIKRKGKMIITEKSKFISPGSIFIPGDFSSASFFIVLGLILEDCELLIRKVNINPTRCGLLNILKRMKADIKILNRKDYYEPYADILVKNSCLSSVEIKEQEVPLMIDEIPVLSVAASFARGRTLIRGLRELKVKETDRLEAIMHNLRNAGVKVRIHKYIKKGSQDYALEIQGTDRFNPCRFKSFSDHRTAMSAVILGKGLGTESSIDNIQCINKSFPEFMPLIEAL